MNRVILMGRLTKDPEIRYLNAQNPMAITRYTLAVNRKFAKQGEQQADFINCTVFGKSAEFAEKYFKKGQLVAVEGRMQIQGYTDLNTKEKKWYTEVLIEQQHFAEAKRDNTQQENPQHENQQHENQMPGNPQLENQEEVVGELYYNGDAMPN